VPVAALLPLDQRPQNDGHLLLALRGSCNCRSSGSGSRQQDAAEWVEMLRQGWS